MPKKDLDPEQIQKKIDKLEKKLESVEQDVYSPEAQKEFSQYAGSREEFLREKALRQIASGGKETGKGKFLSFLAAAAFGDADLTEKISKKYQEKYSKEEIEEAKKTLEKEFGVKKKEDEEELVVRKFKEVLDTEISPIKKTITGITKGVEGLSKDIERTNRAIKSISDNLINTINQTLTVMAGGRGDLDRTPDKMKPMTVASEEGKEYLYYPDAPPGRQLYEKSKTGTAGRIASKEVQRELESELKRLEGESQLTPVRAGTGDGNIDDIVSQIKILLEEESMFRKRDMEKLIGDLKESILAKKKSSIFDAEPDEQERIMAAAMEKALDKTLYNALKDVFERNPDLLSSGGFGFDLPIPGRNRLSPNAPTPDKKADKPKPKGSFADKAKNLLSRYGGGARGLAGRGALMVGGVALAATAVTAGIFGALDFGMKESGDKAIRDISKGTPQDIATAIKVPKYGPYTLQELERMAADDPELRVKLDKAKVLAGIVKPAAVKTDLTLAQPQRAVGESIVDQNQKRIEIDTAERVEIPAQSVTNVTNNSVIPIPSGKKNIEVHNTENTFNRLLAQEFDHPATYASMNMG